MKIKYILDLLYNERDFAGNVYWAFRLTSTATGKQSTGRISGGESNIRGAMYYLNGEQHTNNYYYTSHQMKKREFNRLTAGWPYAGCQSEELAKYMASVNKD